MSRPAELKLPPDMDTLVQSDRMREEVVAKGRREDPCCRPTVLSSSIVEKVGFHEQRHERSERDRLQCGSRCCAPTSDASGQLRGTVARTLSESESCHMNAQSKPGQSLLFSRSGESDLR
jgi:hypothetical protein